jgi:hypothetical protein
LLALMDTTLPPPAGTVAVAAAGVPVPAGDGVTCTAGVPVNTPPPAPGVVAVGLRPGVPPACAVAVLSLLDTPPHAAVTSMAAAAEATISHVERFMCILPSPAIGLRYTVAAQHDAGCSAPDNDARAEATCWTATRNTVRPGNPGRSAEVFRRRACLPAHAS